MPEQPKSTIEKEEKPPFLRPRSSLNQAAPPGSITPKMPGSFMPAIDMWNINEIHDGHQFCMYFNHKNEKSIRMRFLRFC